jgi:hypothetical protein
MELGVVSVVLDGVAVLLLLAGMLTGSGCATSLIFMASIPLLAGGLTGLLGIFLGKRRRLAAVGLLLALGLVYLLAP